MRHHCGLDLETYQLREAPSRCEKFLSQPAVIVGSIMRMPSPYPYQYCLSISCGNYEPGRCTTNCVFCCETKRLSDDYRNARAWIRTGCDARIRCDDIFHGDDSTVKLRDQETTRMQQLHSEEDKRDPERAKRFVQRSLNHWSSRRMNLDEAYRVPSLFIRRY